MAGGENFVSITSGHIGQVGLRSEGGYESPRGPEGDLHLFRDSCGDGMTALAAFDFRTLPDVRVVQAIQRHLDTKLRELTCELNCFSSPAYS